jgi:hypothetical protein
MTITETIYSTLSPLVTNNRVFIEFLPPGTFTDLLRTPAIRYSLIAAEPDNTIASSTYLADQSRYQIDFYASNRTELLSLVNAARTAMTALVDPPPTRELETSGYEEDTKLYVYTIDWMFHPSA